MLVLRRETFNIEFDSIPDIQEGQLIKSNKGLLLVLKTYPYNNWRKLLKKLGFKTKERQIKVCKY